ncbi:MAG: hypothetical protein EOP47_17370 [Sphingobacteriaceae bacterium]|nr:MAG: hypothetical protein EOP47_17370 [Sphingobacteriaceae bacterium]
MKKSILILTAITALFLGACKKDKTNNPTPGNDTYQPFSTGSQWKYRETSIIGETTTLDTSVNTMTAEVKTISGKQFHVATAASSSDTVESLIGLNNNIYSTIMNDEVAGGAIEYQYLNESKPVNDTWQTDFQIEDGEDVFDARLKTTIVEKGISKTVLDKNYTNVIHTKVELQFKVAGNYVGISYVDFYIAKGVGIIGIYSTVQNKVVFKSELFNYTIK